MSDFADALASISSKEAAAARRDPDRMAEMIEQLARALGLSIAIASGGDKKTLETLCAGAEAYVMEEAVGRSRLMRLLRGEAA